MYALDSAHETVQNMKQSQSQLLNLIDSNVKVTCAEPC